MRENTFSLSSVLLVTIVFGACVDAPTPMAPASPVPDGASFHVGYKGDEVPLGFVTNDAECHIGKKGSRWPAEEQYEVKTYDAHLVVSPSGVMTLTCTGDIPADQPRLEQAEVEQGVLCFLPNRIATRDAREVFTPGGKIILTCQYNPNRP